jgi:hypothetical protein
MNNLQFQSHKGIDLKDIMQEIVANSCISPTKNGDGFDYWSSRGVMYNFNSDIPTSSLELNRQTGTVYWT